MGNDDPVAAQARLRSYVGPAIITMLLYLLLWLPGLVVNIVWLSEARKTERLAGTTLPGVGCLRWMLMSQLTFIALVVVLAVLIVVAIS
jgi:hypothetical protein